MDDFAADSARYSRAFSTDFWTLPSHASILTGLYPSEAGATSETNHLPADVTTLAEHLKEAGYQTGAVVCNAWVSAERGFDQGFTDYVEMWRARNRPGPGASPARREQAPADQAVAWIERHAVGPAPFFLFINFNMAHLPYRPPSRFRARFQTGYCRPGQVEKLMGIMGEWAFLAGALKLESDDLRIMADLYAGEVAFSDECVGKLLDALSARGVLDETLVVTTSDHGENLGDHGMIGHAPCMYETTMHVPLIIRYPKRFETGAVIDDLVSLVDLTPTILDVCNLWDQRHPLFEKRTSLCGPDRIWRTFVVAENERPVNGIQVLNSRFPEFDTNPIDYPLRMIRTDRHKLIWHVGRRTELYDLLVDRRELHDMSQTHADIRDELLEQLEAWVENAGSRGPQVPFESRDAEALELLRSLGYVQ